MNAKTEQLRDYLVEPDNDQDLARDEFRGSERAYCDALFELLECDEKRAKNRAAKLIANLAKAKPKVVYTRIEDLIALLASTENILLWNAVISLGHLAAVDSENRIADVLPKMLMLLKAETMVTAANTIDSLVNIMVAKPQLAGKIIGPLLQVVDHERNDDCQVVLTARVAKQVTVFAPEADGRVKSTLLKFAEANAANANARIAKPSAKLLKKLG
tara:strand:- start:1709 stop:2356 length:648 start_codon:yes stop_codon:yes gene_type:complete